MMFRVKQSEALLPPVGEVHYNVFISSPIARTVKQSSTSDSTQSSSPGLGRLTARENGTKPKDHSPAVADKDKSKGEDGAKKDSVFI